MAGSVNKVILVGNLGRDPEIRSTQDGLKIVNLSLATSESWRDRNSGERRERTETARGTGYEGKSYCTQRRTLLRDIGDYCGPINPVALRMVAALPERFPYRRPRR